MSNIHEIQVTKVKAEKHPSLYNTIAERSWPANSWTKQTSVSSMFLCHKKNRLISAFTHSKLVLPDK